MPDRKLYRTYKSVDSETRAPAPAQSTSSSSYTLSLQQGLDVRASTPKFIAGFVLLLTRGSTGTSAGNEGINHRQRKTVTITQARDRSARVKLSFTGPLQHCRYWAGILYASLQETSQGSRQRESHVTLRQERRQHSQTSAESVTLYRARTYTPRVRSGHMRHYLRRSPNTSSRARCTSISFLTRRSQRPLMFLAAAAAALERALECVGCVLMLLLLLLLVATMKTPRQCSHHLRPRSIASSTHAARTSSAH
jgi:hypothetical protein